MRFLKISLYAATCLTLAMGACKDDESPIDPIVNQNATLYVESPVSLSGPNGSVSATLVTVDDLGEGTGTVTWTKDKTYQLKGLVFVNDGQTLTIEPGTVIRGEAGQGENASALVVARGGKINANGTAVAPIIFTSAADNTYSTSAGLLSDNNLSSTNVGLWGGLIVLGKASLNSSPGESAIEGINTLEKRGLYGGTEDADNSGVIRYVSIRHGGTEIGAGNEINGLTLGGVGSGTTVEYVEVFGNKDDGFEWFGGTVNTKYLISAYNNDDAFDYDEGWRGNNQFWLAFQRGTSDRGGEHDGGTDPETGTPYATPTIANASYFGLGAAAGKRAATFRDNAGGNYYNSIFSGYAKGIDVEYLGADLQDSYKQLVDGNLKFEKNILWDIAASPFAIVAPDVVTVPQSAKDFASSYFLNKGNTSATDPGFGADGITPATSGAASADLFDLQGSFFEKVNYKGAINPATGPTWIASWTRLSAEMK